MSFRAFATATSSAHGHQLLVEYTTARDLFTAESDSIIFVGQPKTSTVLKNRNSIYSAGIYTDVCHYHTPMKIRDALEADADALAAIANSPTDVMRNLVHDRTVRVAEDGTHDPNADVSSAEYESSEPEDLLGFVSFDAQEETVHVTQIDGTADACERLLAEPVRFAEQESMAVELLVPAEAESVETAAERLGFDRNGVGPRFDGARSTKFRLEP